MIQPVEFADEEKLRDTLASMNYDEGIDPEIACVDAKGNVFLACGTDEGDCIGYAYYFTGPEGRMSHYGVEYEGNDVDLKWTPEFPITGLKGFVV